MPTASRNTRKLRRAKLEARRALKMLEFALKQRDQARFIAGALDEELKKRDMKDPGDEENRDHNESVQSMQDLASRNE